MFGYIKPFQPQLRVCELEQYKAVYCGLCRELSRQFGPIARCTLSFDFTFIAMLYSSLSDQEPTFAPHCCPCHPFSKRGHLEPCDAVRFSCEMAMLLVREKCVDNKADSSSLGKLGWGMLLPMTDHLIRNAVAHQPEATAIARQMTEQQREAEALGAEAGIDRCCDPTATALASILSLIAKDEVERRILSRLGYMLGRYIYLCDAVDDLLRDQKDGSFNPLSFRPDPEAHAGLLRMTIAEVGSAYALLEPRRFGGILDNIIYLGLPHQADQLLEGEHHHE